MDLETRLKYCLVFFCFFFCFLENLFSNTKLTATVDQETHDIVTMETK